VLPARQALEIELGRLAEAIAQQGATAALMDAIAARESERRALEQMLWGSGLGSVQAAIADVREFALEQLTQVRRDAGEAKAEFYVVMRLGKIFPGPASIVSADTRLLDGVVRPYASGVTSWGCRKRSLSISVGSTGPMLEGLNGASAMLGWLTSRS